MIFLKIPGNPISKARPRFGKDGQVHDCQSKEKKICTNLVVSQLDKYRDVLPLQGAVSITATFYKIRPPKRPKKNALENHELDTQKPDLDNYLKFYLDILNKIAYLDDSQVCEILCKKLYSDKPRVELCIKDMERIPMIREHAKTVKCNILTEDISYMTKKANRLGLSGREVHRVFMEEDDEGKHFYFECDCMKERKIKEKQPNCS